MKTLYLIYLLTLILLSTLPINSVGSPINNTYIVSLRLDYLLHSLLLLPWVFLFRQVINKPIGINILLGILVAAALESIQFLLPYRSFNINDMLANVLGVFLGLALLIPAISEKLLGLMRLLRIRN